MNFEEDIRRQIARWLSANGYPTDGDLHALVVRYQNITKRMPQVRQWKIKKSRDVRKACVPWRIRWGLRRFVRKAKRGRDLCPYVSKTILDSGFKDLMFYDWGIHHFHLGTRMDERGFIERTNELLFAIADRKTGTMYLIGIHPHRSGFTNQDLLRIIEENWPEVLEPYTLQGVTPSYTSLSNKELGMLRRGGITVAIGTPGGRTLAPMGGGMTTNKTNMQDVRTADYLVWRVRQARTEFEVSLVSIERYFKLEHNIAREDLSFHAELGAKNTIWVFETETGIPVWRERVGSLVQGAKIED